MNDLPLLKNLENIPNDIVANSLPFKFVSDGKNRDFRKFNIRIAGLISFGSLLATSPCVNKYVRHEACI